MERTKILRIIVGALFVLVGILDFTRNDTIWAVIFTILGIVFFVAAFKTPNQNHY